MAWHSMNAGNGAGGMATGEASGVQAYTLQGADECYDEFMNLANIV